MARKLVPANGSGRSSLTTAAGLARRLKVHRGTVTRALRRVPGGLKTRVGHQFMLDKRVQGALAKKFR